MAIDNINFSSKTEQRLKWFGSLHLAFGVIILLLQGLSAIVSAVFQNQYMFEDEHLPGLWLGSPIVLLGSAYIYQSRFPSRTLHKYGVVLSLVVLAIDVFYMAFKCRFIVHDPEASVFDDCQQPRWPKTFILDDMPHCNAQKMNNSIGQSMLAFASADIILIIVGFVLLGRSKYYYERLPINGNTNLGLRPGSTL